MLELLLVMMYTPNLSIIVMRNHLLRIIYYY
jgi:hypothetical protein